MQVIVTSFRRFKYLKQTIESLRQDDVELIIVDDGSNNSEIEDYIQSNADIAILCKDNRGAKTDRSLVSVCLISYQLLTIYPIIAIIHRKVQFYWAQ